MSNDVWTTELDGKYNIRVERTGPDNGMLIIETDGKPIAQGGVILSYGAQFGPDIQDVSDWQEWVIAFIDGNPDPGPLKTVVV